MLGAGTVFLAACSPEPEAKGTPSSVTVRDLRSGNPFYIAHRGSMDNWPEHTAEAYEQSLTYGASAIEVSVSSTADGQLICHHDTNALRMTGVDVNFADVPYERVQALQNDARPWLGPNSYLLPVPLLRDVLDAAAAKAVIFIEDKQGTNTTALLDLMDTYPNPTEHFVWKQSALAAQPGAVSDRGYTTWGYFPEEDFDTIDSGDLNGATSAFDLLGIQHTASDDQIRALVALGKPVICWEVHTRWLRDRLVELGVQGIMCSNIPYVTTNEARSRTDAFATGLRGFGDLPWALAWTHQPTIRPKTSSLALDHVDKASYCMGSMCPIVQDRYVLGFEMRWPEREPRDGDHAGVAFGQKDDSPYRIREAGAVGGYHLVLRQDGLLELFGRESGSESGYSLGRVQTDKPVPGQWMQFRIEVNPGNIRCGRIDGTGWSFTAESSVYRGGYFSLCRNYYDYPPVEFRGVSVLDG
ncbi:MAG: hypothetical protein JWO93_1248 [Micrococcaceae bacterium]|nr:hypothetical protein [Micrococcaceae bacterium]